MKAAAAVAVVTIAAVAGAGYLLTRPAPEPVATTQPPVEARAAPPQLYCQFYVFTEQRPRLAFLFDVANTEPTPVFRQRYIAEDNGERTDYGDADTPPVWRYDPSVDPRTISSTIMVPDTSQAGQHEQDIAIQLYGYEPKRDSKAFFEASLKNIHYQNLPGKCRQAAG